MNQSEERKISCFTLAAPIIGDQRFSKLFGFLGHATAAISTASAALLAAPALATLSVPFLAVIAGGVIGGAGVVGETHRASVEFGERLDNTAYIQKLQIKQKEVFSLITDIWTKIDSPDPDEHPTIESVMEEIHDLYTRIYSA